jgi:hypothetical protein
MYPIRVNRPVWTRSFLKQHTCSELCHTQYEIQDSMIRITYQSGCLFPENVEPLTVHISNHKEIEYIDEILNIPNQVNLLVDYPLRKPFTEKHTFDHVTIRLSDVLEAFDRIYIRIYKEEEEKATKKEFFIDKECTECKEDDYNSENLSNFIHPLVSIEDEKECSICFESDENLELFFINNCKHVFHKACILKWFNTPKVLNEDESLPNTNSCPVCRQSIIYCDTCKGTQKIQERFFGSVPPFNPLSDENRIETDGPYEIHTIYYQELYFKGILYDRIHNTISLLPLECIEE